MTFPGHEIKDLYVHEAPAPAPPAPPAAAPATTAPILPTPPLQQTQRLQQQVEKNRGPPAKPQATHADRAQPPAPPQTAAPAAAPPAAAAPAPRQLAQKAAPPSASARPTSDAPKDAAKSRSEARPAPAAPTNPAAAPRGVGTGEHLLHLRRRGFGTADENSSAGEFDIVQALSAFNKEAVMASVAKDASKDGGAAKQAAYKKDDFFDSLSCDVLDKEEGRRTRMTNSEERHLNLSTFGAVRLQKSGRFGQNRPYRGGEGRGSGGNGFGNGNPQSQSNGSGRGNGGRNSGGGASGGGRRGGYHRGGRGRGETRPSTTSA